MFVRSQRSPNLFFGADGERASCSVPEKYQTRFMKRSDTGMLSLTRGYATCFCVSANVASDKKFKLYMVPMSQVIPLIHPLDAKSYSFHHSSPFFVVSLIPYPLLPLIPSFTFLLPLTLLFSIIPCATITHIPTPPVPILCAPPILAQR